MPPRPRIRIRRVYEAPAAAEGYRVLVDRLWPRGISKEKLSIDSWEKELAPSAELRKWFGHDPSRWEEFSRRYRQELLPKTDRLKELLRSAGSRGLTLLYSARDQEHNQAVVLQGVLEELSEKPE
ncbi:hypothetical protein MAMC_00531 [Methylacidimicrobium cyclopophantes]|uniref:DUF488 domain-containing protein n=1 Tax=Methylacidimicrobium cyclopophantes TaxID=1041766 RepID=A0A5E6M776_9BACT|nr:DUF488 family protein [Methylacidimicrobium cyclopophantes]VVM05389.1 hypothetical protein MAMC_00531 [Methylacidimicrobium cyclopophantes]